MGFAPRSWRYLIRISAARRCAPMPHPWSKTRWMLIERAGSSIQNMFMEILIVWVTLIFVSFGYNAPRNATVATTFVLSAAALAGCIFLSVEMDTPFEGLITISGAPMQDALAHMNP